MLTTGNVPHQRQNGRKTAVTSGRPRAPRMASCLGTLRLTPCLKRPSKQPVTPELMTLRQCYPRIMVDGLPLVPWTHRLKGKDRAMAETRRKFDRDFKEGAVRLVRETGKPIAQVARDLGIHDGTLANWVNADRRRRGEADGALGEDERAELARLRKENAELAMERDVLKRSVALWVKDAMGR